MTTEPSLEQPSTTWPANLWPHVESLLLRHFDFRGGGGSLSRPSKGATEMTLELAERGSIRSRACPKCRGKKRIGLIGCTSCHGSGQIISTTPPVYTATDTCRICNGSGRYRRKGSFTSVGYIENSNYNCRPQDMALCVACRGQGYVEGVSAAPGPVCPEYSPAFVPDNSSNSPATQALAGLNRQNLLVVELTYGPLGRDSLRHGHRRNLALWPLTSAGERLIAMSKQGSRNPSRAIQDAIEASTHEPTDIRRPLVSQAERDATIMLSMAKASLFSADMATGGKLLQAARKEARHG